MSRFARFVAAAVLTATPVTATAADDREVPVHVEPPQPVATIMLQSTGTPVAVAVANGKAKVPAGLPLPWKVAQPRFESTIYTQADMDAQRPLLVRELGRLTGAVREGGRAINRDYVVLVRANGTAEVEEHKVSRTPSSAGAFETLLPAGTYQAVIASASCGTRLRSGIVIKPGARTDLGPITCEPTFTVSFRVVDAKTGVPVVGAKVLWDPSDTLNAGDAKVMYARRWSAQTDRRGAVAIKVGPAPIPVRWRIEADGYAIERTRRLEFFDSKEATIADVKLRPSTLLRVHIHLPADAPEFAGGAVVLGEHPDERSARYVPKVRRPLREGEVTFPIDNFGEKRLWLESASGVKLCYRDIHVEPDMPPLGLSPQPLAIHGRVMHDESGVEGVAVVLADPHDGRVVLAKARTDASGGYALRTYQAGELSLYATQYGKRGFNTGAMFKKLHTTVDQRDYALDFELPEGGFTLAVTDAETHAPVVAKIEARFTFDNGNSQLGNVAETDDSGHVTFAGYPEGAVTMDVSAPGYRAKQAQFQLHSEANETHDVTLVRSRAIAGRVVSPAGAPISGAVVSAGYDDEMQLDGHFQKVTDAAGSFQFDSPPEPGTPFYVVAAGWALAIVELQGGTDNVVRLSPPSSNALYLTEDNAPPKKVYRVVAAPLGRDFIPSGVLEDLAEANGMNSFQLLGNSRDGAVVLPEFLAPGTYQFFISHRPPRGQTRPLYDGIGTLTLPGPKAAVLRVGSKQPVH